VLKFYNFSENDGGEFLHSRDNANWNLWKGLTPDEEAA
jgi:phenol hydroxylase P3 protein